MGLLGLKLLGLKLLSLKLLSFIKNFNADPSEIEIDNQTNNTVYLNSTSQFLQVPR